MKTQNMELSIFVYPVIFQFMNMHVYNVACQMQVLFYVNYPCTRSVSECNTKMNGRYKMNVGCFISSDGDLKI